MQLPYGLICKTWSGTQHMDLQIESARRTENTRN